VLADYAFLAKSLTRESNEETTEEGNFKKILRGG